MRVALAAAALLAIATAACSPDDAAESDGRGERAVAERVEVSVHPSLSDRHGPGRLIDNGDGTVTDSATGLLWEKKSTNRGALDDVELRLPWTADGTSETVWDWIARVNGAVDGRAPGADPAAGPAASSAGGLAGYSDWRIANVKELLSIADHGRRDPAAADAFAGASCADGCTDVTERSCSCTAAAEYWTSTTFSDAPAHAYVVHFELGLVDRRLKTDALRVRAVRDVSVDRLETVR